MTDNSKAIKIRGMSLHSEWQRVQAHFRVCACLLLSLLTEDGAAQTPQPEPFGRLSQERKLQCQMLPVLPGSEWVPGPGDIVTVTVTALAHT